LPPNGLYNGNRPPGSRDSNDWTVVVKQDLIVIM
jgi:hypothetical protein